MGIQWFPGHMTKALREMEKEIKNVDLIFYCLDSRAPISCLNPKLSQIAKDKKIIYVLTKADLVEQSKLAKFKSQLNSNNSIAVYINSVQSNTSKILYEKALDLLSDKIEAKKQKGLNFIIRAMVVGIPNVGKSTLINNFCRKAKTITGDKPGVTKGKQWVTVNENFILLDTPGTLWPSFEIDKIARNLAYIGSIKDNVIDLNDLAFYFIKDVRSLNKKLLEDRYSIKIEEDEEILETFDNICKSKKCLLRNNELDYDRCAMMIIDDFRKGRIGKIILD